MEISEISRSLKALAGELGGPLIPCSQLSRQVGEPPRTPAPAFRPQGQRQH